MVIAEEVHLSTIVGDSMSSRSLLSSLLVNTQKKRKIKVLDGIDSPTIVLRCGDYMSFAITVLPRGGFELGWGMMQRPLQYFETCAYMLTHTRHPPTQSYKKWKFRRTVL